MRPVRMSTVSSRFTAGLSCGISLPERPEVGSEQNLFPRYRPRVYTCLANGRSPADLPISTRCRAAAPVPPLGQSSGSGRRSLHRRGRSSCHRAWGDRQKEYEPRGLLVVRGATGDHLGGQVGGVDGVYQCLRIGFSGLSDERHLVRLGDREV